MPRKFDLSSARAWAGSVAWKEPKMLVRAGLGVLLAANLVAAGFAFHVFGPSPQNVDQQLATARAQLQAGQMRLQRTRGLAGNIDRGHEQAGRFLASYMTDRRTTYSTVIGAINQIAITAGMKQGDGTIAPLQPILGSQDLDMMTVSVNFEGNYAQLLKFVNELDRSPRFLIIESVAVTPHPKGDLLGVNVKLNTFVKNDTGGA
jgi:Tfp pilus assembly protein PilO